MTPDNTERLGNAKSALRKSARIVERTILGLVFLGSVFIISIVANYLLIDLFVRKPVTGTVPKNFPVVVVTSKPEPHATIIYYEQLDQFKTEHPDASFFIPKEKEQQFQVELYKKSRVSIEGPAAFDSDEKPWLARFTVMKRDGDKITVDAFCTYDDDDDNSGIYEATAANITPMSHKNYFGPGACIRMALASFGIGVGFTVLLWMLIKVVTRRFRPDGAPDTASAS